MLIRHGTRRPKAKKIIEMKELAQVNFNQFNLINQLIMSTN